MSCITYLHNDPFDSGGTKFISGTTCTGSASSYNLTFGGSVCMEAELPLVICDGLTISGSCDSPVVTPTPSITASPTPTLTPTQTPTITPTSNPFCGEQVIISEGTSNMTAFDGTYDRVYVWTGGTMNYAYRQQISSTFITGTAPNSLDYVVYKEQSSNRFITRYFNSTTDRGWLFYTGSTSTFGSNLVGFIVYGFTGTTSNGTERYIRSGLNQSNVFIGSNFYASYPSVCPTTTPTPTLTSTPTGTPTQTQTPTGTSSGTTPTPTPTPTQTPGIEIFTHGTVLATCSGYCNTNYQIDVSTPADANFSTLTIGDTIYGQGGVAGFVAYAATSTDTSTGTFRIAEIDSSGVITGIFICVAGNCDPL